MSLEDFELVEEKVQDIRFGIINIFNSLDDKEYLIMEKSRRSYSQEDHAFSCMQAEERLKIQHPNILRMLWVDKDDLNWMTSAYFEYPNEDLCDRKEELNDPRELIKLLNDMLEAMAYLQRHKMVHGDIRPEYIFFNRATERYVLLDRLIDASPAHQAQMNNIFYQDKTLYMSPVLFNELCQGNLRIKHNPFKSEVFSLGMVILSMFIDETDVNRCFNRRLKEFDYREFTMIADHLKNTVFTGNIEDLLGEYLFLCILNLNEKERLSPKKALKILRKGICKALNTIVPNPELQAQRKPEGVNPEAQNLWEQYHSAKEKIEAESGTEKESNMTGSLKSGTQQFVNDERLNMPNMGGGDIEEEETEEQDSEEYYNESMPVNSNNMLIKDHEIEPISKSNSISYMKEYQSESGKKGEADSEAKELLKVSSASPIRESEAFDSKVDLEDSNRAPDPKTETEGEVEIEVETEDIPDEKQDSNKLRIFEVMNDNSMSGTNNNEDTFYGSGSNQGDKIMGLNDIYEKDINKLQKFLQNTGDEDEDIVLSRRSENDSQKLYQSNASGYESGKPPDLTNFQSYTKVEEEPNGFSEQVQEEGEGEILNIAQESGRKIKTIFRGGSDEDLRGPFFEDMKGEEEFDIDQNNLALGEVLQKMDYQSGEDFVELQPKPEGSPKGNPPGKNEQHYFSYGNDNKFADDDQREKITFRQSSPDFGKKEAINLEELKRESMNIQIRERNEEEEEWEEENNDNGRAMNKLKNNQFSMSNKEFLKSQEEALKLLHAGKGQNTKNLLIHEPGVEQGFNNTNTFYATPGEDVSLGDTFDKQMKMKLQEEGVQIVEGELKNDSERELSSRVIDESIARNVLGGNGQSNETHQLKKSLSIESNQDQIIEKQGNESLEIEDDLDSEKLSDVEQISIDTDEFLQGNSGISSRLNSPTSLKTETCVSDIKKKKDQNESGKQEIEGSPEMVKTIKEPLNKVLGSTDEVIQELNCTLSKNKRVIVSSLEIDENVEKLYSEGKRSVDDNTRKYFKNLGIEIMDTKDENLEDLRKSFSEREFNDNKNKKNKSQTTSEKAIKYSFKKKENQENQEEAKPIEIDFEDLEILEDVEPTKEVSSSKSDSDKSFDSELKDKIEDLKENSSQASNLDNLGLTNPKEIKKESIFYINNASLANLVENNEEKEEKAIKEKKEKKKETFGLAELSFISSLVKDSMNSLTKDIEFNLQKNIPESEKSISKSSKSSKKSISSISENSKKSKKDLNESQKQGTDSLLITEDEIDIEKRRILKGESGFNSPENNLSLNRDENDDQEKNLENPERDLDIVEVESHNTVKIFMNNEQNSKNDSAINPEDVNIDLNQRVELENRNFVKKSLESSVNNDEKKENKSNSSIVEDLSDDSLNNNKKGGFQMIIKKSTDTMKSSEINLRNIEGVEMENMSEKFSSSSSDDESKKQISIKEISFQSRSTEKAENSKTTQKEGNEKLDSSDDSSTDSEQNIKNKENALKEEIIQTSTDEMDTGVYGTDKTFGSCSDGSSTLKTNYIKNPSIFKTINSVSGIEEEREEDLENQDSKSRDQNDFVNHSYKRKVTDTFSKNQEKLLTDALEEETEEERESKDRGEDNLIDIIDGDEKLEIEAGQEQILSVINKQSTSDQFKPITEVTEDPSTSGVQRTSDNHKSSKKILEKVPELNTKEELNLNVIKRGVGLNDKNSGISPKNVKGFNGEFQYEHVTELRNSRKHTPIGIDNYQSEGNQKVMEEKQQMNKTGNIKRGEGDLNKETLVHSALNPTTEDQKKIIESNEESMNLKDSNLEKIRKEMELIPQGEGSSNEIKGFLDTDKYDSKNKKNILESSEGIKTMTGTSGDKTMTLTGKLQVGYQLESELQDYSEKESRGNESMFKDEGFQGENPKSKECSRLSEKSKESSERSLEIKGRKSQSMQEMGSKEMNTDKNEENWSEPLKSLNSDSKPKESNEGQLIQSEIIDEGDSPDLKKKNYTINYEGEKIGNSMTIGESLLKTKELKEHSNFSSIGPRGFRSSDPKNEDKKLQPEEKDLIHREMENETNSEESESEMMDRHQVSSERKSEGQYGESESEDISQSLQVGKNQHFSIRQKIPNNLSEGQILMKSEVEYQEARDDEENESFSSQNDSEEIEITDDDILETEGKHEINLETENEMKVINSMEGISIPQEQEESENETHYKEKPHKFEDEISQEINTEENTLVQEISEPTSQRGKDLFPSKSYEIGKGEMIKMNKKELEEDLGRKRLTELDNIRTTESRFNKLGSEGRDSSMKRSRNGKEFGTTAQIEEKNEDFRNSTPVQVHSQNNQNQKNMSKTLELNHDEMLNMKLI